MIDNKAAYLRVRCMPMLGAALDAALRFTSQLAA
jgi:hypothetical protein